MDKKYKELRQEIEQRFEEYKVVEDSKEIFESPSGKYILETEVYSKDPNTWAYSRGKVFKRSDNTLIADIKRNISHFWKTWCEHPNGNEYLLCGEDYQGYTVINLTKETVNSFFPDEGHDGIGFCWTAGYPSPNGKLLAIDGCFWACPYELVLYDFTNPDELPFKELSRTDSLEEAKGWKNNSTFIMTREVEIRKSDGAYYNELSEKEQDMLDNDPSLSEYKIEEIEIKWPF